MDKAAISNAGRTSLSVIAKDLRNAGYEISVHSFMHIKLWRIASLKGYSIQKIFWTLVGLFQRLRLLSSLKKYDCIYIFMNVFRIHVF